MIKFFRRIRQKLLSENKLTRYLFYAFGEIILVMIGILLALQVNNWNEERKSRDKEAILVNNIVEDLNSDAAHMDRALEELDEQLVVVDACISKACLLYTSDAADD